MVRRGAGMRLDERVQRARHLEDRGAAGDIVVGALLDVALEQVRRDDDLVGVGIGARNHRDDVLQVVVAQRRLDLGVHGDDLAGDQAALERLGLARWQEEAELGVGVRLPAAADAAPGDLQRVEERPAVGDRQHPFGAEFERRYAVHATDRALGDGDLADHVGALDFFPRALPDPHQLGGDVGGAATVGQHGALVLVGNQLLASRTYLPQLALLAVPHLAAGKQRHLGARNAVAPQLADDVLGLQEGAGVLGRLPVTVVGTHLQHRVPGGLARGFTDDLVHDLGVEEGPLVPGRHLRLDSGDDDDEGEEDDGDTGLHCGSSSGG